jgi:hypothetical protein
MPIYNNALAQRPANMLAYQDSMSATPRNEYLGALADLIAQSYSPERTQQMQGISRFLSAPEISQTLDRLSYGEPLTTGAGMTTRIRPEAAEAALALAPSAKPVTMATLQAARAARKAALAGGMAGERYAERVIPQIMERGGMPAQLLQDLAQGTRSQIFVGEKSKTWNAANAAKALEMEKAGVAPEEIWFATGTFRGPEGKLRQEISDANSSIVLQQKRALDWLSDPGPAEYPIGSIHDLIQHQELINAYPSIENIRATLRKGQSASYFPNDGFNERIIAPALVRKGELVDPQATRSSTLHELQHAIQQREDFAEGGSADFENYMRLAGEAEARAVQKRMNMTPQQRLATYPYQSYDVPINQLIVRTK